MAGRRTLGRPRGSSGRASCLDMTHVGPGLGAGDSDGGWGSIRSPGRRSAAGAPWGATMPSGPTRRLTPGVPLRERTRDPGLAAAASRSARGLQPALSHSNATIATSEPSSAASHAAAASFVRSSTRASTARSDRPATTHPPGPPFAGTTTIAERTPGLRLPRDAVLAGCRGRLQYPARRLGQRAVQPARARDRRALGVEHDHPRRQARRDVHAAGAGDRLGGSAGCKRGGAVLGTLDLRVVGHRRGGPAARPRRRARRRRWRLSPGGSRPSSRGRARRRPPDGSAFDVARRQGAPGALVPVLEVGLAVRVQGELVLEVLEERQQLGVAHVPLVGGRPSRPRP